MTDNRASEFYYVDKYSALDVDNLFLYVKPKLNF